MLELVQLGVIILRVARQPCGYRDHPSVKQGSLSPCFMMKQYCLQFLVPGPMLLTQEARVCI